MNGWRPIDNHRYRRGDGALVMWIGDRWLIWLPGMDYASDDSDLIRANGFDPTQRLIDAAALSNRKSGAGKARP